MIAQHPRAGVFHSRPWLESLQQTYNYQPVALTTCAPSEPLRNAALFCKVDSWITGHRLVSLPFSDHCDLMADAQSSTQILVHLHQLIVDQHSSYAELRPLTSLAANSGLQLSDRFYLHTLALDASPDTLFSRMHKDCIQRKVRRAGREGLTYERGSSSVLLSHFYQLLLRTRRRHHLPPQPVEWFRNLQSCFGERLTIRLAYKNAIPIAALLTLSFRQVVTYKYGCSDERFNSLGGMPFLFWNLIEESHASGMQQLNLGRTDLHAEGLATFKDRLGAARTELTYLRCYAHQPRTSRSRPRWLAQMADALIARLPDSALAFSGRILYRHMG